MRMVKRVLCLLLALLMVGSLCACGSDSSSSDEREKTPEEQVRSAVEVRGMLEYFGSTIGGNELKSSRATITNIKQISDTEYLVSGRMTMTDVYGDTWNNTFDCEVSKSGDNWSAGSFDYTSDNWRKG